MCIYRDVYINVCADIQVVYTDSPVDELFQAHSPLLYEVLIE